MRRARQYPRSFPNGYTNYGFLFRPALTPARREELDAALRRLLNDFSTQFAKNLCPTPEQLVAMEQFMQRLFTARKKAKAQILSTQHNQEENTTKKESYQ